MVQILFHRKKCIGCNGCAEVDPARWRVSKKDGRCNLVDGSEKKGIYRALVHEEEYARLVEVSTICPVKIIHIKLV